MYKLFANCCCWHLDVERITRFCILMLKYSPVVLHIKTHCNHSTFLQKKLYHNFWLYRTFLGCHILTFSFYRLLNVYTKNPGLPPRADVLYPTRIPQANRKKKHWMDGGTPSLVPQLYIWVSCVIHSLMGLHSPKLNSTFNSNATCITIKVWD
jgi:hypothetical protein